MFVPSSLKTVLAVGSGPLSVVSWSGTSVRTGRPDVEQSTAVAKATARKSDRSPGYSMIVMG